MAPKFWPRMMEKFVKLHALTHSNRNIGCWTSLSRVHCSWKWSHWWASISRKRVRSAAFTSKFKILDYFLFQVSEHHFSTSHHLFRISRGWLEICTSNVWAIWLSCCKHFIRQGFAFQKFPKLKNRNKMNRTRTFQPCHSQTRRRDIAFYNSVSVPLMKTMRNWFWPMIRTLTVCNWLKSNLSKFLLKIWKIKFKKNNFSSRQWRVFTGNEMGTLASWWIWTQWQERNPQADPSRVYILNSAVSSQIVATIAQKEGFYYKQIYKI